jgi:uncharacterized Tic20 family protein
MSYQTPPPPAAARPLSPEADKQAAMWANIGGIVGFLPSLLIWLILKDRGPRTNVEAKEALNWQITWIILSVALTIVVDVINSILGIVHLWPLIALIGTLPFLWWLVNVIFSIIAGVTINNGGSYRYPLNFRFIK